MKIVFIVNALHMQRCIKRIDEFAERGYSVVAYGFDRGITVKKHPQSCVIEVIGKINDSKSYLSRLKVIYNGIRHVLKATKGKNVLYYVFGLDNVMFFRLLSRRRYIYEESDLVHTYIKSSIVVRFLEYIDKYSIKKSVLSVFTSEGFLKYHFGNKVIPNTVVVANRLPVAVLQQKIMPPREFNCEQMSIGFVGFIRFNTIYNFAKVFCEHYPNSVFHFFGTTENDKNKNMFDKLKVYPNCIFHGAFKHPDQLPEVYSQLDLVLSTYDVENDNVRYAEPNKIYESIFYETPIIVSSNTFLAEKVKSLGIGYDIDATNEDEILNFVNQLSEKGIKEKIRCIQRIDKRDALNINDEFFKMVNSNV